MEAKEAAAEPGSADRLVTPALGRASTLKNWDKNLPFQIKRARDSNLGVESMLAYNTLRSLRVNCP